MSMREYMSKYKHLLEYTNTSSSYDLSEEGEDDTQGGAPADPSMGGGDPSMGGGDPSMGGGDPSMGGGDPSMGGGDPSMGGGDPSMGGGDQAQGPEGFNPQGVDPNSGIPGMGGDSANANGEMSTDGNQGPQSDDDVVNIDDFTKSQKKAEKAIDDMNSKFEKLMGAVDTLIKQNQESKSERDENLGRIEAEMEKRNPTPLQRLSMRSTKSAPYSMTPNEYANNYMPDNYSDADDNNGADDPQYQITKDDIDRFTDYNSIARDLDVDHQGLHDILGM